MKKLFAALALAAVVAPVWAATQTVTLSVPGMTCSTCPITVKKAISKVEGVSKVNVTSRHAKRLSPSMMPRPACRS
ncbi:putative periplasmic mercuric ion binding protein component of transporter [Pseudomonas aeruginosa PA38182]|nr:putative periplasmic mercuric ion binding protein component of transporter [Pseudomonas aeruginosa PA38182]